ncbi:MAG: RNA 2',3'-cyclic phosphodiesterase [Halobacteria archaeon]|nr:RNA 2',3'-cyclic phosphodiesterase [Halobacteria archaeon]
MSSTRRLFVSVDVPEEVQTRIEELQSVLGETNADISFVAPQQAHITIKFLGDTPAGRIDEIEEILDEVTESSNHEAFEAEVRGTGVFPSRDYISVVWVGVKDGSDKLTALHEDIEERIVDANLADEEKNDFVPHITIGRMKSGRGKTEVHNFLDEYPDVELGEFDVTNVRLKESTLESDGPVYDTVYEARLE